MISRDGRYVIVFNGEIYNYGELRNSLAERWGVIFRSDSDTEVLLEAISEWGLETALSKSDGMFAMAIFDRRHGVGFLARDRFGEKPLYYGSTSTGIAFGSELKAIRALTDFRRELAVESIRTYFHQGFIPAPLTAFNGTKKLPPGTFLRFDAQGFSRPIHYWSLQDVALEATRKRVTSGTPSLEVLKRDVRQSLVRSVGMRLRADVPVGVFLSGGIDSSLVAAIAQGISESPIDTFSVAFEDQSVDESARALAVANSIGTRHHQLDLRASEALTLIAELPSIFDEPFADPAAIANLMMAKAVAKEISVALTGDGADELFGGYNEYRWMRWVSVLRRASPAGVIRGLIALADFAEPRLFWDGVPTKFRWGTAVFSSGGPLDAPSPESFRRLDVWGDARVALRKAGADPHKEVWSRSELSILERALLWDQVTRLPDRMLAKVDRTSMAASLEVRLPFLDVDLARLSWSMPSGLKIRGRRDSKFVLRSILEDFVPAEVSAGAKKGLSLPLAAWLRAELRGWATTLIEEELCNHEDILDTSLVRKSWDYHLNGKMNNHRLLWTVLAYLQWAQHVRRPPAAISRKAVRVSTGPDR